MRVSRGRLFVFALAGSSAAWAATCALLRTGRPGAPVFAAAYRMTAYHEAHPYAFIGVVSVSLACVAGLAGPAVARLAGGRRGAALVGVVVAAVVLAGIPGGLLYMAFDIAAGFFPESSYTLRSDLEQNLLGGIVWGPLVAAGSVPFSVLALAAGVGVVEAGLRWARVVAPGGVGTGLGVRGVEGLHSPAPLMDDMPDTDALSTPATGDPETPTGTGATGTGTTASGAMGSAQTGAGAGQSGDDIDPTGADTTGADMTGVGVSSPGTIAADGVAGGPDDAA